MHQADPYRELRQICVYILMRNSGRLLAAAKAQKLAAELETQQTSDGWVLNLKGVKFTLNDLKIIQGCWSFFGVHPKNIDLAGSSVLISWMSWNLIFFMNFIHFPKHFTKFVMFHDFVHGVGDSSPSQKHGKL